MAQEDGFGWTQTEEELEVIVLLHGVTTKQIKVCFRPKSLQVTIPDKTLDVELFERIDVDSCTWTLEEDGTKLVVSMEKVEAAFWPRIRD